ncbi:MAG TPA: hypothetical protein VK453_00325 [Micromonosporaceae bacterium]|nr:hypothetical protein [Micromonosporaceae bacterium]
MSGRLQRGCGQGAAEIRLGEPDQAKARRSGVVTQPTEGEFVGGGDHDQDVGVAVPGGDDVGVRDGEVESGMSGLTGKRARIQICTGDEIQARGVTLTVWHAFDVTTHGPDSDGRKSGTG